MDEQRAVEQLVPDRVVQHSAEVPKMNLRREHTALAASGYQSLKISLEEIGFSGALRPAQHKPVLAAVRPPLQPADIFRQSKSRCYLADDNWIEILVRDTEARVDHITTQ